MTDVQTLVARETTALAEVLDAEDILRPLGVEHRMDPEAARRTLP